MTTSYRRKPTKAELRRQKMEELVVYPFDWLEERSGLVGGVRYFLFRNVPSDINWMQTLGSAALTAFLVQAITGVILAMYYVPSADIDAHTGQPVAWESIVNITDHLTLGWLVRGMHKWGASVFIILMFLHMGRVFLFGAYKYPRELNWIVGVLILVMGMMEGFTGYLLPWDQTAYWASVVGINLNGTAPFLGPWLAQFLRGGQAVSGETLTRFYSLHMLVIPGGIIALITLHLYLVIRLGVTSPPWSKDAAGGEPEEAEEPKLRPGLTRPVPRPAGASPMQAEPGGRE
jgi:quinol---cytochrome c reductase cytochrome b subunit, bacillus type